MPPPLHTALGCLLVVPLLWVPARSARAEAGRHLSGNADIGFDSFQERYSIVDEDTLDSINEFRSRLALAYTRGSLFEDYLRLEGRAMVGEAGLEYSGSFNLIERFSPAASRFGFSADVTRRDYRENSTYEFSNDFTRYYLRSYLKWNASPATALRLTDRVEIIDYEQRTQFDYDYFRNTIALDFEYDWNLTNLFSAGVGFTTKDIPDSTDIQYESWSPVAELRLVPGPYRHLLLYADVERRLYAHEPSRSSFWSLLSSISAELPLAGPFSVEGRNDIERYVYDAPDDIYFDYTQSRNALLIRYNRSWDLRIGAGPTYGFFVSDTASDDEYSEYGGKLTVDYMRGRRAWVSAAYERGRRGYDAFNAADTDVQSIYSDYNYDRINVLATLQVWDGINLSTLLDYQPEDHEREGDDATATLFSVSASYSF